MGCLPIFLDFALCIVATLLKFSYVAASSVPSHGDEFGMASPQRWATLNLTYRDPITGTVYVEQGEMGLYGSDSRTDPEWGWVVHVRTADNKTHACTRPVNAPPADRWIALIERGTCKFHDKIYNTAILLNASAVVIYNNPQNQDNLLTMKHSVSDVVSIFIGRQDGERLAAMVDNGTRVLMHIAFSRVQMSPGVPGNRTSVLFVSISFILLMVISVAWLIFYYIQRFRYAHTKDRLSKRLMNAAKKAVNRMEQRTLRKGDQETDPEFDLCAVCVEGYKVSETVRILPCRHMFHRSCIDPWLIERRSCPICKLDILQACGIHVHCSRESQGSHVSTNTDFETPYFLVDASELLLHDNIQYSDALERPTVHGSNATASDQLEATQSLILPTSPERERAN